MKVLFMSSEVAPYASTGGVGDSAGALTRALARNGVDLRVALPLYRCVRTAADVTVTVEDRQVHGAIETDGPERNPGVLFVRNDHYYGRSEIYGYEDEAERFIFFCKAALSAVKRLGFRPDVVHCNDWQTGLAPALLRYALAEDPFYNRVGTVFTLHNLAHQGCFGPWVLRLAGLPAELLRPDALEFYGQVSFLKAGIVHADIVTALGPSYAREIQTEGHGENLHGVLAERADRLVGVLNGIDEAQWDPETDAAIAKPFGPNEPEKREDSVRALRVECGFDARAKEPILALASPLATQYGLGVFTGVAQEIVKRGCLLVVAGRGDTYYERLVSMLESENPGKVRYFPDADEALRRRVLAGSHFLLRPSLREPYGQEAMIALRYGCIPISSLTGPLRDIVGGGDQPSEALGFTFDPPTSDGMLEAIDNALAAYREAGRFQAAQRRAMTADFSWDTAAAAYCRLYDRAAVLAGAERR